MGNLYRYNIKVVRVIDGDSIVADVDLGLDGIWLKEQNIRLWGIDCPPIRTKDDEVKELGYEALEALITFTEGRKFTIKSHGRCKYGRILADVFDDWDNNICEMMLECGHAVPYEGGKKTHKWGK